MSIFRKIITAIRGGAREVGEAIVDANSTRIFEQEIKDAEQHLAKAKQDLTQVMAKQMQEAREVERLKKQIAEHETYAAQALEKGEETLALEIATKIGSLEEELATHQSALDGFKHHADRLKELVKKTERQLADYNRQLTMVKTTESVHKATEAITTNFSSSNSKLMNAKDSLERIKQRQQNFDDRLKAAEDLEYENSDKSLTDKMKAAGIGAQEQTGNDILARIKAKQNKS